jgi:hypothetical protein
VKVAALILWILTAGGGFVLLGTWVAKGGARRGGAGSRFPVPLIFGHFLLAATGLVLWIVYVAADKDGVGWTAFGLLAVVALLGFSMLALWIPTFQATRGSGSRHAPVAAQPAGSVASGGAASSTAVGAGPAERHFPVPIVVGHGLLAATTLVLVLLTMLDVGSS